MGALAGIAGLILGAQAGDERSAPRDEGGSPARAERARPAAGLPLEQQVGQVLIVAFDGTVAPEYVRRRLRLGQAAGVIIFGKNAPDEDALRALTTQLQRAARGGALVTTDQEGGDIRSVAFAGPAGSQGTVATPDGARRAAGEAARGLSALGLNVNLAPVADVASGPDSVMAGRAYPGATEAVAALVGPAVRAHAAEGVAATAKHFPGLGAARENTDDVAVTIGDATSVLRGRDLPPFRAAVDAGAPLVMSSHALYPALDGSAIASQSSRVLKGVLREQLGFRGVVITDSIEAGAVLARSDVATAAERSLTGGSDLVLMTGSGSWNEVYPRLLRRAKRDRAFRERVAEAAGRVLALKRRLGLPAPRP